MWPVAAMALMQATLGLTPARAPGGRAGETFRAAWKATDGFNDASFNTFDERNYEGMKNDKTRTPVYAKAIRSALADRQGEMVVLDIGTGPEALLALFAAKFGARKVYAVEASPAVAAKACQAVKAAGYEEVVEVITGFSTEIELPELADLLVAEIVGSVASDEGIYATMHDAQRRHMKRPNDPASYIPRTVETWCAPVSYALHHHALGPSGFDWEAVRRDGPPPRFACSYPGVKPLAQPQLLEQIRFGCGVDGVPSPGSRLCRRIDFEVCTDRMKEAEDSCANALKHAGCPEVQAAQISQEVASGVSGIAMWPRLLLGDDQDDALHIESRGTHGRPQRSHWQVAMPLLCANPRRVVAGEKISVLSTIDVGVRVDVPNQYELNVEFEGAGEDRQGRAHKTRDPEQAVA